jgi:hypothetical protein
MYYLAFLLFATSPSQPENIADRSENPLETCAFYEIGADRSTYLGFKIYDAKLHRGTHEGHGKCARLDITYLRRFNTRQIIKASDKALRRQFDGDLSRIQQSYRKLNGHLENVRKGDRFTMDYCTRDGLTLLFNNEPRVTIDDPLFAQAYLGIWLHPEFPIDRGLRKELMGDEPWPFR